MKEFQSGSYAEEQYAKDTPGTQGTEGEDLREDADLPRKKGGAGGKNQQDTKQDPKKPGLAQTDIPLGTQRILFGTIAFTTLAMALATATAAFGIPLFLLTMALWAISEFRDKQKKTRDVGTLGSGDSSSKGKDGKGKGKEGPGSPDLNLGVNQSLNDQGVQALQQQPQAPLYSPELAAQAARAGAAARDAEVVSLDASDDTSSPSLPAGPRGRSSSASTGRSSSI